VNNQCENYQLVSRAARVLVDKYYMNLLDFFFSQKESTKSFDIANFAEIILSEDIFQLSMHTLLVFSNNYPLNIRNYFEHCDKKYLKQSDYILKTYIGPNLFQNELDQIELRQSGNFLY